MPDKSVVYLEMKVASKDDDGTGNGSFEAILSAPTVDRDGEVVAPKAFDPLPDRIPIHVDHRTDTVGLVGSAKPYYAPDGTLRAQGTFASDTYSQRIRQYVKDGHLDRMSIGFLGPQRGMVNGTPTLKKGELVEASFVTIPANTNAAVTSIKSLGGKAVAGSYEALRQDIQSALQVTSPNARIVATFPDSVVFESYGDNGYETFKADYVIAKDGAFTISDPAPVSVTEVVAPKSPADPADSKAAASEPPPTSAGSAAEQNLDELLMLGRALILTHTPTH